MALTPQLAQVVKGSSKSLNKLIVVIIAQSGFSSFNNALASFASFTITPVFSLPMISPMSFPITFGLTSTAPTITPPFSIT